MRNSLLIFALVALIAFAFYRLGIRNGANETKTTLVENVAMVKQIAELSSLQVSGTTQLKISNASGGSVWANFKNYFVENTLMVSLPFDARYGVDMSKQQMRVDTKTGKVTLYFPACQLLNLQLRLDKLETMSETGIFASATIADLAKAQSKLYTEARANLENNANYKKLAEDNIRATVSKYYQPLGYEVTCVFGEEKLQKQ